MVRRLPMRRPDIPKCLMCKTTWLYGSRRQMGICTRCHKIAIRRNDLQIALKAVEGVTNLRWLPEKWPGILVCTIAIGDDQVVSHQVTYDALDQWEGTPQEYIEFVRQSAKSEHED